MSDLNSTDDALYAFVIDGDVVWRHQIPETPELEMVNAIFSSNPQIVRVPPELGFLVTVNSGWRYVDGQFLAPE